MIAELVDTSDARWRRLLHRVPHDVYHRPEYVALAARHEGGAPAAFYAECAGSSFLLPLLIRPLPPALRAPADWSDATTPYGYPGPILSDPGDPGFVRDALTALQRVGSTCGIVSVFARLHPLVAVPLEAFAERGRVMEHGETVLLDLTAGPDRVWSAIRSNHRTGIRKLARAGYTVTMDDWEAYAEFPRLYRAAMARLEAAPFYFFSDAYFAEVAALPERPFHFCAVRAPDGGIAAAGLFTELDGLVHYHLGATAEAHRDRAPSKQMFDCAWRWAQGRGARVLHLGGGVGGRADSLFHFKAGFSTLRARYRTYRMVLHPERYATLESSGADAWPADRDFFPSYRRPGVPEPTPSLATTPEEP